METTTQQGWVKLFYQFCDWEWYGDPNMVALFIHLLLRANFKPVRRKGEVFGRGVVITSREELSRETGISERTIRTCLNRLKSTNEITIKATKQGSVITLTNYDKYQAPNLVSDQENAQPIDQQATNDRPTSDQQVTSSIERKNKRKKEYFVFDDIARREFLADFFSPERQATVEQLCMARGFGTVANFKKLADAVLTEWECVSATHRNLQEARQHLINQCASKLNAERREQQNSTPQPYTNYGTRISNSAQAKRERMEEFQIHILNKLNSPETPEFDDGFD